MSETIVLAVFEGEGDPYDIVTEVRDAIQCVTHNEWAEYRGPLVKGVTRRPPVGQVLDRLEADFKLPEGWPRAFAYDTDEVTHQLAVALMCQLDVLFEHLLARDLNTEPVKREVAVLWHTHNLDNYIEVLVTKLVENDASRREILLDKYLLGVV
jgi:hypothetical protein